MVPLITSKMANLGQGAVHNISDEVGTIAFVPVSSLTL